MIKSGWAAVRLALTIALVLAAWGGAALAQITPTVHAAATQAIDVPAHRDAGATQIIDNAGNVIGTVANPVYTTASISPAALVTGVISSAMTGTTSTSLLAAPSGSLHNYVTQILCYNTHATVSTDILIQDGSGGTTIGLIPAAAVYGGATVTLPSPLRQPTAATALYVQNVTTGASTKCWANGYTGV